MNETVEFQYGELALKPYIAEILSLGLCPLFFQGCFIHEQDKIRGIYQTGGYRILSDVPKFSAENGLSLLIGLLRGIYQCGKYYLFEDDFLIDINLIYVDNSFCDVKMIFKCCVHEKSVEKEMEILFDVLKNRCSKEGAEYMRRAEEILCGGGYGYKATMHQLEKLRTEVYLCGAE